MTENERALFEADWRARHAWRNTGTPPVSALQRDPTTGFYVALTVEAEWRGWCAGRASCAPHTEPAPARMCNLNGWLFPEPLLEVPARGFTYWVVRIDGHDPVDLDCVQCDQDKDLIASRLCHATRDAALAHGEALRASNHDAVRGAK